MKKQTINNGFGKGRINTIESETCGYGCGGTAGEGGHTGNGCFNCCGWGEGPQEFQKPAGAGTENCVWHPAGTSLHGKGSRGAGMDNCTGTSK